jgi:N-acetylmuramoyl-L-alanine amidase
MKGFILYTIKKHTRLVVVLGGAAFLALTLFTNTLFAGEVIRREIEPGVYVSAKNAKTLGLEVHLPAGNGAKGLLSKYLSKEGDWVRYKNRLRCFVPYDALKESYKRQALLTLYKNDYIDSEGWHHTALMEGETLWTLSEWIVGSGARYKQILADKRNRTSTTLSKGNTILIPKKLLSKVMAEQTERRYRVETPELAPLKQELIFDKDQIGSYAQYTMKEAETLYTSIVTRFTTYEENAAILDACKDIARRSRINDMRDIKSGQKIKIPVYMLSDAWQPKGSAARVAYEASIKQSERMKSASVYSRDLSDVVVILDPGHGGADHGVSNAKSGLYEDEINYDIVCRIKQLLERDTGARVYITLQDSSNRNFTPTNAARFSHDTDEVLLTTPPHKNNVKANVSANLRWMMANAIYDKEVRRGVDPRKIIFTSVHTDSIFNSAYRGSLVYIPGAKYRRPEEIRRDKLYQKYYEGQNFNHFSSTSSERRRDEAISRNFAEVLLDEMGAKRIKRHDKSNSIRTNIRRNKTQVFVPAVLRNTKVPTKILVETANMQNAVDRKWLSDSWWRQQFAEAYVNALKTYFKSSSKQTLAFAD